LCNEPVREPLESLIYYLARDALHLEQVSTTYVNSDLSRLSRGDASDDNRYCVPLNIDRIIAALLPLAHSSRLC
jgi:hypothetical protein